MAKAFAPVVFTANDLVEGDTVYLGAEGWVRDIRAARVAADEAEKAVLEDAARAGVAANLVVGPYDVAVTVEAAGPWPVKRREQIKATRDTTMPVGPEAVAALRRAA
ncbi:MAG: DUF2849 domain-containing protein [Pseudomonadota bacterium]